MKSKANVQPNNLSQFSQCFIGNSPLISVTGIVHCFEDIFVPKLGKYYGFCYMKNSLNFFKFLLDTNARRT